MTVRELPWIVYDSREAWLAERHKGVGASEAASALGVGRESPFAVWARKCWPEADLGPRATLRMRKGSAMEPFMRQLYQEQTGNEVLLPHAFGTVAHPAFPFIRATPDGLHESNGGGLGVVEFKDLTKWSWDPGEPVPTPYLIQIAVQMMCCCADWADFAALVDLDTVDGFAVVPVKRDLDLEHEIEVGLVEFWDRVQTQTPPDVDGSAATTRALRLLYPEVKSPGVVIPLVGDEAGEFLALDARRAELKAEAKRIEAEIAEADNRLRARIGDAEAIALPGGVSYSYKLQAGGHVEYERAAARVLRRHEIGRGS